MEPFPRISTEVYSVSRLTQAIKAHLESGFSSLWVEGEISNFRVPASGHFYFTLKDESSQIRAVMFRSRNAALPFVPEDGMQVVCRADLSVYAPRGEYQLIVEWIEPKGRGGLQLAFEALKEKLASRGFFDADRKRPLPYLPRVVGVVTSPTGAAVRDILKVLWRRFPNLEIRFCPVRVQGVGAAAEVAAAIRLLNEDGRADVIIVGRGGGSLEDLWAFNEEVVALAISESRIPVVSAVGHEIDFTIADLVADVRAPTPSAAAEIVVPEKEGLVRTVLELGERLRNGWARAQQRRREVLTHLAGRMVDPGKRVEQGYLRLDDLSDRLRFFMERRLETAAASLGGLRTRLDLLGPGPRLGAYAARLESTERDLARAMDHGLEMRRERLEKAAGRLEALSPLGVLGRGYSITRALPSRRVLRRAVETREGELVEVILAEGRIECRVKDVVPPPEREGRGEDVAVDGNLE